MKKETIIFIAVLAFFTMLFVAFFTNIANADVDLSQCTVNNQLEVCNQSLEKSLDVVEVETIVETKKEITLNEFIYQLVEIVKERKAENDIVITANFESDTYNSVLVENQNQMKCVNDVCALEKNWR